VFARLAKSILSADELSAIMEWAQAEAYGEALDENHRCKYRWTWLPHFYIPDLSFYNYPYTFGLLFSTGLYAVYRERGDSFVSQYKELLAGTGMAHAADLAQEFGIDIRTTKFWQASLEVIGERIEHYAEIAQQPLSTNQVAPGNA
jgi:oligoendopeptidase F